MTKKGHQKFLLRKRKFVPKKRQSFRNLESGEKNFRPPNSAPGLRPCHPRNLYLIICKSFFLFLVLWLPRQIHTSNSTIHHDVQISPSTCCNSLSSSISVTSFSVFLFSSILPSNLSISEKSPLLESVLISYSCTLVQYRIS